MKNESDEINLILQLSDIIAKLGWMCYFDSGDKNLTGMCIGTPEYIQSIFTDDEKLEEIREIIGVTH